MDWCLKNFEDQASEQIVVKDENGEIDIKETLFIDWNMSLLMAPKKGFMEDPNEHYQGNDVESNYMKRKQQPAFTENVIKQQRRKMVKKDQEIRSLYGKLKLFEKPIESPSDFEKEAQNLDKEGMQEISELETKAYMTFGYKKLQISIDEETIKRESYDEDQIPNRKEALESRVPKDKELDDMVEFELNKQFADDVSQGTKETKEMKIYEANKASDLIEEGAKRKEELVNTEFELQRDSQVCATLYCELMKARNTIDEETQRRKELGDFVHDAGGVLDIEEEISTEIEDLRKENIELWLRFSTSYHQINRFQDSFADLQQEIKLVQEKKHEHGDRKHHYHQHHSSSFASIMRPLYRHLRVQCKRKVDFMVETE
ncbi:hypothetical protein Tco_0559114 [Tanacetum coccineum]